MTHYLYCVKAILWLSLYVQKYGTAKFLFVFLNKEKDSRRRDCKSRMELDNVLSIQTSMPKI